MNNYTLVEESAPAPNVSWGTIFGGIVLAFALVVVCAWLFERLSRKK